MPLLTKIIAIAAVLGALLGLWYMERQSAIDKAVSSVENTYALAAEKEKAKAIKVEEELKANAALMEKEKDDKIKDIDTKLKSALERLRLRPSRTEYSIITETIYSCTGAQLFREDGEFLAGEAARADKIIAERDFYYEQYEKARKKLEDLKNGKK